MATISDSKALEIARELANSTFKQREENVLYKIRTYLLEETQKLMGDQLYYIFKDKPKYFNSTKTLSLYPGGEFGKFFPNGENKCEIYPNISFPNIPLPQWDSWQKDILEAIKEDGILPRTISELYKLEIEKRDFRKKVHCLISHSLRTEKRLQKEFPEAYEVLLKIDRRDAELTVLSKTPCDTVENLRAIVQSNKPYEKSI